MTALTLKLLPPAEAKGEQAASYGRRNFQFQIPVRETARPFVTIRLPFRDNPSADVYADTDGTYWSCLRSFHPRNRHDQGIMRQCFQTCIETSFQSGERAGLDKIMFSVIDGLACRRTLEPMLRISIDHQNIGRTPLIETTMVTGHRPPKDAAASDKPQAFFRIDRRLEMDGVVAMFRADWPKCSNPQFRRGFELHEGAAPHADDATISFRAALPAVLTSGHAVLHLLPRGALDNWLSLRNVVKDDPLDRARMALAAGDLARFATALSELRSTNENEAKSVWRARIHTQLLSLRLAVEPDLIPSDPLAGLQL